MSTDSKLIGEMIEYEIPNGTAQGYLVKGEGTRELPGLIVIQEWWGVNDHIKDIAKRFAMEGYVVLAPDLYDGVTTKNPDEAGKRMQGLQKEKALRYLKAAVAFLQHQGGGKTESIGVTGFCMGGTYALLLACHNDKIKACAPFYGDIPSEEELKNLSAPVLFIGAAKDNWITLEKMGKLEEGLKKFHKEGTVKIYPDAGHAFFNDTRPEAYNAEAAKDAWEKVTAFLAQHLQS